MIIAAMMQGEDTIKYLRRTAGVSVICCSEDSLLETVTSRAVDVVLVEPGANLDRLEELVRVVHQKRPTLTIALFCRLEPEMMRAVVRLCAVGATEVLLQGHDDVGAWCRRRAAETRRDAVSSILVAAISQKMPRSVAPFVRYCLSHAHESPSVDSASRAMGIHRRTLAKRLAAAEMLPPRAIISWCRLLVALERLERTECSAQEIATRMRFGSAAALYKMCSRYTGMSLGEIRKRGGLPVAVSIFLNEIADRRVASTASGGMLVG